MAGPKGVFTSCVLFLNRIVVLEEVEQLGREQILYTLFEWPGLKNSKLILIGMLTIDCTYLTMVSYLGMSY